MLLYLSNFTNFDTCKLQSWVKRINLQWILFPFINHRSQLSEKLLYGKAGDVKDASRLYAFTSRAGISNARENSAAKGSNSFMWNTFKILFIYFILFFVFCFVLFFVFKSNDWLWSDHPCSLGIKPAGYIADRIFAPYSVYKGKAALSVTPVLPTFTKLDVWLFFWLLLQLFKSYFCGVE